MSSTTAMLVKKLSAHAVLPSRGSAFAAGYDLSSAVTCVIPARGRARVATDIAIAIPAGTYGRVAPRSGLAFKNGIDVGAGVIGAKFGRNLHLYTAQSRICSAKECADEDYRGNVGVILFNHSDEDFNIKPGDRIAQLILEKIAIAEVQEVEELSETVRGEGGFGSTGVAADPAADAIKKARMAAV